MRPGIVFGLGMYGVAAFAMGVEADEPLVVASAVSALVAFAALLTAWSSSPRGD